MSMEFEYWTCRANEECSQPEENNSEVIPSDAYTIEQKDIQTDESGIPLPIRTDETDSDLVENIGILDEVQNKEIAVDRRAKRICKAIFLGVPFGIPLFFVMLVVLSICVVAVSILFGILVMTCSLLLFGGLGFVVLGIANVHLALAPSFLLIGSGILGMGLGIFLVLLTRLVFKYVLLGVFKVYILPVKFIRMFFVKKTAGVSDSQSVPV